MIKERFRNYLPVILDLETGGLDPQKNSIIQLACCFLEDSEPAEVSEIYTWDIAPHKDTIFENSTIGIHKIDPYIGKRMEEELAIKEFLSLVQLRLDVGDYKKAIVVAHNSFFDFSFLQSAMKRAGLLSVFHEFASIDTASLSFLFCNTNILPNACKKMDIEFSNAKAHNATYDVKKTAELFCKFIDIT